ncbi:MAG: hypothetical protein RL398_638 [Planctomycetota bacterium]
MNSCILIAAAITTATLAAQSQHLTVPAAYATAEANSLEWVAGTSASVRQQTLIGASHLTSMVGRDLTAIEIRRASFDQDFQAASMHWTVTLSISSRTPLTCDDAFAANVGPAPVVVFDGTVQAPFSPADATNAVPWSPQNVIRAQFQQPYRYDGGTLCLDIVGTPIAGQTSDWWVGDAVWEDIPGTVTEIGAGCGAYGGAAHRWAYADPYSLMPGARARFSAYGTPNSFAIAAFGAAAANPMPLSAFGLNAPGCNVYINPALVLGTTLAFFEPITSPMFTEGLADTFVQLPADPWTFGLTLTTQWFDLLQPATSNAIRWTVGSQVPTLDMAHVDGDPLDTRGLLTLHLAPVYRFEHQ